MATKKNPAHRHGAMTPERLELSTNGLKGACANRESDEFLSIMTELIDRDRPFGLYVLFVLAQMLNLRPRNQSRYLDRMLARYRGIEALPVVQYKGCTAEENVMLATYHLFQQVSEEEIQSLANLPLSELRRDD